MSPTFRPHGSASEIGSTFRRSSRSSREQLGQPLAAARGTARSPGRRSATTGHDRHVLLEREPDEALAAAEVDAVALPRSGGGPRGRRRGRRAPPRRPRSALRGVLRRGGDRPVLAQEAQPGHRQHEVVGELVEAPLDAEVGEKASVKTIVSGVRLPPEWLPTSSTGPSSGMLPRPRTSPRKYRRGEQPQARQRLADVVGVALVEVGGRDRGCCDLPATRAPRGQPRRARRAPRVASARRRRRAGRRAGVAVPVAIVACAARPGMSVVLRRRGSRPRPARAGAGRARRRGRRSRSSRPVRSAPGARPAARGRSRRARSARRPAASARRGGGSRRDQLVVRAPDEQRRRLELGQPRVEAVAAERLRRGRCCARAARNASRAPARAVDALELVDDDVGHARVHEVAVGEQRPELALDARRGRASAAAARARGAASRTSGWQSRRTNATAGHSSAERRRRARARAGRPRSPRGRPSSCRRGARARSPARPSTPSTVRGEPAARRRARSAACTSRRSRAGRARGRGSGRLSAAAVSKNEDLVPPRPCRSSTSRPLAHRQRRDPAAAPTATSWMRSSGGRPLGRRNRPSKPTARSRSPRAYSRRWENASTPDSSPSRSAARSRRRCR